MPPSRERFRCVTGSFDAELVHCVSNNFSNKSGQWLGKTAHIHLGFCRLKIAGLRFDRPRRAIIKANIRAMFSDGFDCAQTVLRMPHPHPDVQRFDFHPGNLG